MRPQSVRMRCRIRRAFAVGSPLFILSACDSAVDSGETARGVMFVADGAEDDNDPLNEVCESGETSEGCPIDDTASLSV